MFKCVSDCEWPRKFFPERLQKSLDELDRDFTEQGDGHNWREKPVQVWEMFYTTKEGTEILTRMRNRV